MLLPLSKKFPKLTAGRRPPDMHLRELRPEDCAEILRWRNDSVTRAMSLQAAVIDDESHKEWFNRLLADDARFPLVGVVNDLSIGWIRFDPWKDRAGYLVSITIAPEVRSKGFGSQLLRLGLDAANTKFGRSTFYAEIKTTNLSSKRIFAGNGFKLQLVNGNVETMVFR